MNRWLKTIVLIILSIGSIMMVTACGGSPEDTDTNATGSNWDQMQWDKGQWK